MENYHSQGDTSRPCEKAGRLGGQKAGKLEGEKAGRRGSEGARRLEDRKARKRKWERYDRVKKGLRSLKRGSKGE